RGAISLKPVPALSRGDDVERAVAQRKRFGPRDNPRTVGLRFLQKLKTQIDTGDIGAAAAQLGADQSRAGADIENLLSRNSDTKFAQPLEQPRRKRHTIARVVGGGF